MTKRSSFILRLICCILIVGEVVLLAILHRHQAAVDYVPASSSEPPPGGVPELSRQRHRMQAAERAIRDGDGLNALRLLEDVNLDSRPVEIYRRYFLANAKALVGEKGEARAILAKLWSSNPEFAHRNDVAFHLADLYAEAGDWPAEVGVLEKLAHDGSTEVSDASYQRARAVLVASGDPVSLVRLARHLAVRRAEIASGIRAMSDLALLDVGLTRSERVERAIRLAAKGEPASALAEVELLRRTGTTLRLEHARAVALARLGKRDEADGIVLTFVGKNASLDRDLLASSWRWWSDAAQTIEARVWHNIRVRSRSGTKRVKVRGKWVNQPVYTTVTKRVKRSLGSEDRRRLAAVQHTLVSRGERLLELAIDDDLRAEIHLRLAHVESNPRRQAKLEEHVRRLVGIDPASDEMLQLFWDEGWAAWRKRDLETARARFAFVASVYRSPNIRQQARYWYARSLEQSGETGEATRIYQSLQQGPYEDVYATLARERAPLSDALQRVAFVPFDARVDNWVERAENEMPPELRLAWELSLLGLNHDARNEIRENQTSQNRSWAYSILARTHRAEDSPLLVGHTLRRAWPELGTVDQDNVPVQFLRMFYPTRFHDLVERESMRQGIDAALAKGLILQESAYDPRARSGVGATGLMQLMPPTAREAAPRVDLDWDESMLVDPEYNITIGTYYLRTLLRAHGGDPALALAAYNAGIGNVGKWRRKELKGLAPDEVIESIPFSETRGYVKRVTLYRSTYRLIREGRSVE